MRALCSYTPHQLTTRIDEDGLYRTATTSLVRVPSLPNTRLKLTAPARNRSHDGVLWVCYHSFCKHFKSAPHLKRHPLGSAIMTRYSSLFLLILPAACAARD